MPGQQATAAPRPAKPSSANRPAGTLTALCRNGRGWARGAGARPEPGTVDQAGRTGPCFEAQQPRRRRFAAAATVLVCAAIGLTATTQAQGPEDRMHKFDWQTRLVPGSHMIVIAHRGASGYLPEHTIAAYAAAHAMGADYIEPDVVSTADGHLICLHDIHLEATTNVEEVFPDRARDDGRWYAADFTLEEIRLLGAEERLDGRFPKGMSSFAVPTLAEMIELVQGMNRATGRNTGIYPEIKAPAWHREQGLPLEETLLELLGRHGYREPGAPVFVQSFEPESLKRLRELGSKLPQVLLMAEVEQYRRFLSPDGMADAADFADGIGPAKTMVARRPEIVSWANEAGLLVHPYTFRADQLPDGHDSVVDEIRQHLFGFEANGVFTDHPDMARGAVDWY